MNIHSSNACIEGLSCACIINIIFNVLRFIDCTIINAKQTVYFFIYNTLRLTFLVLCY